MSARSTWCALAELIVFFVLVPSPAKAVVWRPGQDPPATPVRAKLKKLFVDVDESVRKAAEDAELVFSTLLSYDNRLETRLSKEVDAMNQTLVKLLALDAEYRRASGAAAQATTLPKPSKMSPGMPEVSRVQHLLGLLQSSKVGAEGRLEVSKAFDKAEVYEGLRRTFQAHRKLAPRFSEVYAAFAGRKGEVMMTHALLNRTVLALADIHAEQKQDQSIESLVQTDTHANGQTAYSLAAVARRGLNAEDSERSEELGFNVAFTRDVLRKDSDFLVMMREEMGQKARLVNSIRSARDGQLRALRDLIDLLDGRYTANGGNSGDGVIDETPKLDAQVAPSPEAALAATDPNEEDLSPGAEPPAPAEPAQPAPADTELSFIQVGVRSSLPHELAVMQRQAMNAIRHNGDRHAILMKVKSILDEAKPIDAISVQDIVTEMGAALKTAEKDQSQAKEAMRRCRIQQREAVQEEQSLQANMALMAAVQNRTKAAIEAAQKSLFGIDQKTKALQGCVKEFDEVVGNSLKALAGHARDRGTIMAAMSKANAVSVHQGAPSSAQVALMNELQRELNKQDVAEKAYRGREATFQASFDQYVTSYMQLLEERRSHYEGAASALSLYTGELDADAAAQRGSLHTSSEMRKEGQGLCDAILAFYQQHGKRRDQLSSILRAMLPKVPEIMDAFDAQRAE